MKRINLFFATLPTIVLMNGLVFAQDTTLTVTAVGNVGIGTTNPSQKLDVVGSIAVSGTVDGVDVSGFKADYDNHRSNYFQFGDLNFGPATVSSTGTRLNTTAGTHSFTKSHNDTKLEVYVNSRFSVGTISGASGVEFYIRIDLTPAAYETRGSILTSNTSDFQSLYAVFQNIPAGSHTVSIWGQAQPSGSASSVVVDPGGWGGKIIVKESR